ASLLVRGGERTTLLGSGMAPIAGRIALTRLAALLERDMEDESLPAFEPLPRAAQLVLISDFLAPLEATNAVIARSVGAGLKGHTVQIAARAEEDLPFTGRVRFEGVEDREELLISRVETLRDDYDDRFRRHCDGLRAVARAAGWTFGTHRTDHPPHL